MILHRAWVFISVPRCATHSLYHTLETPYHGKRMEGPYHRRDIPHTHRHLPVFTCVRNPWTRTVSAWGRKVHPETDEPMGFEDFVLWLIGTPHPTKPVYQPQTTWLEPVLGRVHAWHLETLDADMRASGFTRHHSLPRLWSREERGLTLSEDPWGSVSGETREKWRAWCAEDFERFGYDG